MLLILGVSMIIGILTALLVQSALLRAAISFTNGVAGGRVPNDSDYEWGPGGNPRLKTLAGIRIPDPGTGLSLGIVAACDAANFVLQLLVSLVYHGSQLSLGRKALTHFANQLGDPATALVALPVGFVVNILLIGTMLPTTTGKAALVAIFQSVIAGAILVTVLVALGVGFGGIPIPR
jgi:hypothetical protein